MKLHDSKTGDTSDVVFIYQRPLDESVASTLRVCQGACRYGVFHYPKRWCGFLDRFGHVGKRIAANGFDNPVSRCMGNVLDAFAATGPPF